MISFNTTPPHVRIAPADGGPADPDFFRRRRRLAEQRLVIHRAGALRHWVWHLDRGPIARRLTERGAELLAYRLAVEEKIDHRGHAR